MKLLQLLILLVFCNISLHAQKNLEKGNKVYVEAGSGEDAKKVASYASEQLSDWSYWKVVKNKKEADLILKLDINTHGGVTWTSWGGKSVQIMAIMETKDGKTLWQSKKYKSSPNGSNNFNSANASVNKLVKGLKNEFGRG